MYSHVWIFVHEGAMFPGGVFSKLIDAEAWIAKNCLTGVLTQYPVDVGVYDWAIERGFFAPKPGKQPSARLIGGFTSVRMEHYHYFDGSRRA